MDTPFPNQSEDAVTDPSYDGDVVAWANEQARRLRAGEFHRLDIEHIADEIESVGKSEKRELESRLSVLMAHLLKWRYQPEREARAGPAPSVCRGGRSGGSSMRCQASRRSFKIPTGDKLYGTTPWP